jgi:hypothetical protein
MTDKNKLDEALQYIDDAKSKFDLIYACREASRAKKYMSAFLCLLFGSPLLTTSFQLALAL